MKPIIIATLAEASLKGKNKKVFTNSLKKHIKYKMKESELIYKLEEEDKKFIIRFEDFETIERASLILSNVVGLSWIYWGYEVEPKSEIIKEAIVKIIDINIPKTYRFTAKVYKKNIWASTSDFVIEFASFIKERYNLKVDLEEYDLEIISKVWNESKAYIYTKHTKGLNGLPTGTSGKGLVLLSGGIDSPVASFMMQKRGLNNDFVTFLTPVTATEETLTKIKKLAKSLSVYNSSSTKLYIVDLSLIQSKIMEESFENYRIVLLRRAFMRLAEEISKENEYDALITGEALAQVASQTINAQKVISESMNMLIFKPLIGFDKVDIISIARKIGTYDLSILRGEDTCSSFAPKQPIINPSLEKTLMLEERIPDYKNIIKDIIKNHTVLIDTKDI